ncbi:DedA family protein [Kocuria rhizophila]|uniref:DedA family protein n=1 Tax=Kocuria rhizophila TaxID=72000 RepID=UPI001EF62D50|nr:VTT domain-containing protein [Kocuria rhizophila]MCG7425334.1 VTT domain-containing protein [Kocuria rhizophila]MCT1457390.1 VTT domain-containing protein [Kocuria rhizophila]MCT1880445.1 VTT domain-containing protein [Kocuria rhizophila]
MTLELMQTAGTLAPQLLPLGDPEQLLQQLGPWALAGMTVIVFIESGLLFPFLPGDSLLFTGGLLHEALGIPLWLMILVPFIAAVAGDQVGYFLGHTYGRRFFKDDARFLKTSYLRQTEAFFHKYGGRSIVLARFVPIVRTFVPLVAGAARHPYRQFVGWNVLGGFLWVTIMVVAGSLLGGIPLIRDHVDLIAILIVFLSLIPVAVQIITSMRGRSVQS